MVVKNGVKNPKKAGQFDPLFCTLIFIILAFLGIKYLRHMSKNGSKMGQKPHFGPFFVPMFF